MGMIEKFKLMTRDKSYDQRRVLNSEELIKTARFMEYTLQDIANLCDVSKTTVSHWGNVAKQERPTRSQIDPLLKKIGLGRFKCELEPLSPAVTEYSKALELTLGSAIVLVSLFAIWYVLWQPYADQWNECKALPWHERLFYGTSEIRKDLDGYREYKKLQKHDEIMHN